MVVGSTIFVTRASKRWPPLGASIRAVVCVGIVVRAVVAWVAVLGCVVVGAVVVLAVCVVVVLVVVVDGVLVACVGFCAGRCCRGYWVVATAAEPQAAETACTDDE